MFAVVDAEALILCADEDRRHDVSNDEHCEECIVQVAMIYVVKNGEQYQASSTSNRRDNADDGEKLLPVGRVWCEFAQMSQPSLSDERQSECDDGRRAHGNEERLQVP